MPRQGDMLTLALDVDGVLLDADRAGAGHWSLELHARFNIDPAHLRQTFFAPHWSDVVTGRQPVETRLACALDEIGSEATVEAVLACWFEADYVPIERSFDLACKVASRGHRVVLATNQEHRRASYLKRRIGAAVPLADVFYSAELGYQKQDRRFFSGASDSLGLAVAERSNVVFVDDALVNVETARAFGWQAIHAQEDGAWRHEVGRRFGLVPPD